VDHVPDLVQVDLIAVVFAVQRDGHAHGVSPVAVGSGEIALWLGTPQVIRSGSSVMAAVRAGAALA
jgi:hypothetical protein